MAVEKQHTIGENPKFILRQACFQVPASKPLPTESEGKVRLKPSRLLAHVCMEPVRDSCHVGYPDNVLIPLVLVIAESDKGPLLQFRYY